MQRLLRSVFINCGTVATVPSKTQIANKLVLNLRVSAAEAQCVETNLHCHIRSTRRPVVPPLALPKIHSRQTTEDRSHLRAPCPLCGGGPSASAVVIAIVVSFMILFRAV